MPRRTVDRGDIINGVNQTVRDNRVPYNFPRAVENYQFIDGKATRRKGASQYNFERFNSSRLVRQTPTVVDSHINEDPLTLPSKSQFFRTPLSYALLRWHTDYQPKSTVNWSLEFLLKIGDRESLVEQAFVRRSRTSYGGGSINLRRSLGVVVYDQTVTSNVHSFNLGASDFSTDTQNGLDDYDVFALPALAISYDANKVYLNAALVDLSKYFIDGVELEGTYTTDEVHVAVTFDPAPDLGSTQLTFYLNGIAVDGLDLPDSHVFAGEEDSINGQSTVLQRDIVLLNECTARAGYSSTCKIINDVTGPDKAQGHQMLAHDERDNTAASGRPEPWALCPPRGSGMSELRYWNETRLVEDIVANMNSRLDTLPATLASYWTLNDGGPVCIDRVLGRLITLHHTYPGYIKNGELVSGNGLVLADGQHLIRSYDFFADDFQQDSATSIRSIFEFDETKAAGFFSSQHDFTVQLNIVTPHNFGQELNANGTADTLSGTNQDTRDAMEVKAFGLADGDEESTWTLSAHIRDEDGTAITSNQQRFHRAFDSTLWSIEAWQLSDSSSGTANADNTRIALTRGLITPSGEVAFEFFGWSAAGHTREFRIVSTTILTTETAYTLTFRKKTIYFYQAGSPDQLIPYAYELSIFINDSTTPDVTLTVGKGLGPATDIIDANMTSMAARSGDVADVIVGASYINNRFDRSIRSPDSDSPNLERFQVSQHFMSPYQDQPGFFTLGFFRMWETSIVEQDIARFAFRLLDSGDSSSLLFNVQVEGNVGKEIPSKSKYSVFFNLGFKAWGIPEPVYGDPNLRRIRTGWLNTDCIGYGSVRGDFDLRGESSTCFALSQYTRTLAQDHGVLTVFDDAVSIDGDIAGSFAPVYFPIGGLLSNFAPRGFWEGTNIGDRNILTSISGEPKIFNGEFITTLGFGPWRGGFPSVVSINHANGELKEDKWYGIQIAYFAESDGIVQLSPRIRIKIAPTHDALSFGGLVPHPDPRVTSMAVQITTPADTKTALNSGAHPYTLVESLPNKYIDNYLVIKDPPTENTSLTVSDDSIPQCQYSASYNSRLYVAGDPNIPDIIYFSQAGQPERFDLLRNRLILEESTGDRIIALFAMFGSLFAFKANSIWKIDEVAVGQHQVQRIARIGPASANSIEAIVIPDSGAIALAFWTHHGPYIFDEISLKYIGAPLETPDVFSWLDPTDVFVSHDISNRELLFYYKSKDDNGNIVEIHDRAVVYNYRTGTWNGDYTGALGHIALSTDISKVDTSSDDVIDQMGMKNVDSFLALIGSANGMIFRWGDAAVDGLDDVTDSGPFDTGAYDVVSGLLTARDLSQGQFPLAWTVGAFAGLWITVIDETSKEHFTRPIKTNGVTDLTIDLTYKALPFQPQEGDRLTIGIPPASIEFPYDVMDSPYFSKQVNRLISWHNKEMMFRFAKDWGRDFSIWRALVGGNRDQDKTEITAGACESFKLELKSFELDSALDSYMYQVTDSSDSNIPKQ